MRIPERSCRDEGFFGIERPGDAVNLCRLNRFLERERWNDGWDAFSQHRFAGAGRPDHQGVMTASHCDFNGAFDVSLAFDLAEIDIIALMRGKKSGQIGARRKKWSFAAEKRECLSQILHAVDVDLIDHCGL